MDLLNTHHYDGKLLTNVLLAKVQELGKNNDPDLTTEKNTLFGELRADIHKINLPLYKPTAVLAINRIMQATRKPPNYDPTNGIYADDVLYLVCNKIEDPDTLPYLAEQLSDIITSGPCAQGRCTRLFQVLLSLED